MSDPNISPNMNLPVPVASTTVGPAWATDVVACLDQIDSHTHATGQGVPITPDGLNINASLPMGGNYLTGTGAMGLTAQSAALSGSLTGYVYRVSGDLYYNDGSGNQIRITQSGSVSGSSGTITGLPSGTASAAFGGSTFTFQSATNTPATMNIGPIVTGAASANSKTVTIAASGSQPANYATTLPLALPASTSFLNCDTSGNQGYVAATGSGSVVLASGPTIASPTFTGSALGNISAGGYVPTATAISGSAVSITGTPFTYMHINNVVIVNGRVSGTTNSSGVLEISFTLPVATISLSESVNGSMMPNGGNGVLASIASANGGLTAAIIRLEVNATLTPLVCGVSFAYRTP